MIKVLIILLLFSNGLFGQDERDEIHIWIKAFIPKSHPTNPAYIKSLPSDTAKFMIPSPFSQKNCFLTDQRNFSNDPTAKAKLTTEFVIVIYRGLIKIEKAEKREIHRAGMSYYVDCNTGQTIKEEQGNLKVNSQIIPHYDKDRKIVQVIFQAASNNPHVASPWIDYSLDIIYEVSAKKLRFKATIGQFPAFEAYASLNNGKTKVLFNEMPSGNSAWTLFDLGGIGHRSVTGEIILTD